MNYEAPSRLYKCSSCNIGQPAAQSRRTGLRASPCSSPQRRPATRRDLSWLLLPKGKTSRVSRRAEWLGLGCCWGVLRLFWGGGGGDAREFVACPGLTHSCLQCFFLLRHAFASSKCASSGLVQYDETRSSSCSWQFCAQESSSFSCSRSSVGTAFWKVLSQANAWQYLPARTAPCASPPARHTPEPRTLTSILSSHKLHPNPPFALSIPRQTEQKAKWVRRRETTQTSKRFFRARGATIASATSMTSRSSSHIKRPSITNARDVAVA